MFVWKIIIKHGCFVLYYIFTYCQDSVNLTFISQNITSFSSFPLEVLFLWSFLCLHNLQLETNKETKALKHEISCLLVCSYKIFYKVNNNKIRVCTFKRAQRAVPDVSLIVNSAHNCLKNHAWRTQALSIYHIQTSSFSILLIHFEVLGYTQLSLTWWRK